MLNNCMARGESPQIVALAEISFTLNEFFGEAVRNLFATRMLREWRRNMADISGEPSKLTALFLGNFSTRLDATTATKTGDGLAENAGSWVNSIQGTEFGPKGSHGEHMRELEAHSSGTDDIIATNDNSSSTYYAEDYFIDDKGNQVRIDAAISVSATVTYDNGSGPQTKIITVGLFQMDNGDIYLYPSKEGNLSQTSLDNLGKITSLKINSLVNNDYAGDELVYHDSTIVGSVICFMSGTLIRTPSGNVRIESLSVGDQVMTLDNSEKTITWIGSNHLDEMDLENSPHLRPIIIRKGALAGGIPLCDLIVSPQHRILVRSPIAGRMFGEEEVLVAAKQLLCLDGIEVANHLTEVTYWHFLCDSHQIVFANGAATESLYPGAMTLKTLDEAAKREVLELFPELATDSEPVPDPARPLIPGRLARKLADRHMRNGQPMLR